MTRARLSPIQKATVERLDDEAQIAVQALIDTEWGHYLELIGVGKTLDAADVMIRGNLDLSTVSMVIRHAANGMRVAIDKKNSGGQTGRPPVVRDWFTEAMEEDLIGHAETEDSLDAAIDAFIEQYRQELTSFPRKRRTPKSGEKRKGVNGGLVRIAQDERSIHDSIKRHLNQLLTDRRQALEADLALEMEFEEQ
jgi:hypothetical protein